MPRWTAEQELAINKEKTNIIVSAGAGSGKTAVLTARVIRKLNEGIDIDKLLILTFTNAAAKEMKERIRMSIKSIPELRNQLDLIDGAYITTFDSFSLSFVKKYYYILGINKDIKIADESIIRLKKIEILDNIFDKLYNSDDYCFKKLINDFCTKDDYQIKEHILKINEKLDLIYDKEQYLKDYIKNYYEESFINEKIISFEQDLCKEIKLIDNLLTNISNYVDTDYFNKLKGSISNLINSTDYLSIKESLDVKLPNLPRSTLEEAKTIKTDITKKINDLKKICIYKNKEEIKNGIEKTKDYVTAIISVINEFNQELNSFKKENNIYEFADLSKMTISILKNNSEICNELKNSLNEIMVDEYQDTSDLQEEFISLIENNNVYMVGDIKQSIYRFRNANPYIFKNKYDNYSLNNGGFKIDLNKNFRSRKETIEGINTIFNEVMDDDVGGAEYKKSHQMIFGNLTYEEMRINSQNNYLEIYNYEYDKDSRFSKDEIEAFTIGTDIKNKIKENYQVFDKETGEMRNISYNDFVILMDRATKFDLYKKIFEYLEIPLTKYTDTSITDSSDVLIIKNIIGLLLKYRKNEFDSDFKYFLTSIARSYLFNYSDDFIFKMLENNDYNNDIINIIKEINNNYESYSISSLMNDIIEKFNFYENIIKIGDVLSRKIRLEYLYNITNNLADINYGIEDFYNYLDNLITNNLDIKVSISESSNKSVKIMTIHKSKGLEYPICYYTGLYSEFNIRDVTEKFLYDKDFGIITPYFEEGIRKTIYNNMFKKKYIKEEISEKIRLFYVALTRCREKMIMVCPMVDKTMNNSIERLSYKSFLDIMNSVYNRVDKYIYNVNLANIPISKDYNLIKKVNYKDKIEKTHKRINNIVLDIENSYVKNQKYSKDSKELINNDIRNALKFGEHIHYVFEVTDFKDPSFENLSGIEKEYLCKFLNCGIDFLNSDIYKEVEFVYNVEGIDSQGVIDLIVENDNQINIIDYKLKNIDDLEYHKQLQGYKEYISTKTDKEIKTYLYSIINGVLKEI